VNLIEDVQIQNGGPSDHERIVTAMPEWWGGRDLTSSVLKVFFVHFCNTIYVAESKPGDGIIDGGPVTMNFCETMIPKSCSEKYWIRPTTICR